MSASLKKLLEEEFEITKEEALKNLTRANLETLCKLSTVLCNLDCLEEGAGDSSISTVAEAVIRKYSNGHYDHDVDDLYDAYIEEKKKYKTNKDTSKGENLLEATGRLMAEVYDLVSSMMVDSGSNDERELILSYVKKMLIV